MSEKISLDSSVQGIMMRYWVGLRRMTDLPRNIIRCLRISMGRIVQLGILM